MIALVGIGLLLFGLFSLAIARFRRISDDDLVDALKDHFGETDTLPKSIALD